MSVIFLPAILAILGPEMAAPILWAPCQFYFLGAGIFLKNRRKMQKKEKMTNKIWKKISKLPGKALRAVPWTILRQNMSFQEYEPFHVHPAIRGPLLTCACLRLLLWRRTICREFWRTVGICFQHSVLANLGFLGVLFGTHLGTPALKQGPKIEPKHFFWNFSGASGLSRQNPGISRQRTLIPWVSRDIPNFLAPTPSCGRPLPHRKISGLKSLGLGSFFVPD